jgi:cytochrome c oxidase subunit 4
MTEHTAVAEGHAGAHSEGAAVDHAGDHHNDPEHIRREMRVYLVIFAMLGVLTGITVAVRYWLDLSVHWTIAVALFVATIKASLVAGFFMHLITEKKLIYSVLVLTGLFFIFLIGLPLWHYLDKLKY